MQTVFEIMQGVLVASIYLIIWNYGPNSPARQGRKITDWETCAELDNKWADRAVRWHLVSWSFNVAGTTAVFFLVIVPAKLIFGW